MECIRLEETLPILGHYDVAVIGGGVAGVAAALAAARRGARTLLLECAALLGGLATRGYVIIYLPLCDGTGRRLIGGIAEELLHCAIKNSYHSLDRQWEDGSLYVDGKARYQTVFNAHSFALYLDDVVRRAGIEVLFEARFGRVVMQGGRCSHVVVESRDGRVAYTVGAVVDATGDASVFHAAGAKTVLGENHLSYWGYYTDMRAIDRAHAARDASKAIRVFTYGASASGEGQPPEEPATRAESARAASEFLMKTRALAREELEAHAPTEFVFTGFPDMPQFRTIRMITGEYALRFADAGSVFADSIGCCGDWRKAGIAFEVPYRTLVQPGIENILAAGRGTANADSEAWEVTRVIPVAAMTGEAAGIAAAQIAAHGTADIPAVQQAMEKSGHCIHL